MRAIGGTGALRHRHVWGPVAWDGYAYCRWRQPGAIPACKARIGDGLALAPVTVRWHR